MDRAPVIALTGQVNTQVMGPGAFQEIDLSSAFEAVTRFSQTVLAEQATTRSSRALAVKHGARRTRRRPPHPAGRGTGARCGRHGSRPAGRPRRRQRDRAARPADRARGVAAAPGAPPGDRRRVRRPRRNGRGHPRSADAIGCPIVTTFKGKGLVPDDHPLARGACWGGAARRSRVGASRRPICCWCSARRSPTTRDRSARGRRSCRSTSTRWRSAGGGRWMKRSGVTSASRPASCASGCHPGRRRSTCAKPWPGGGVSGAPRRRPASSATTGAGSRPRASSASWPQRWPTTRSWWSTLETTPIPSAGISSAGGRPW